MTKHTYLIKAFLSLLLGFHLVSCESEEGDSTPNPDNTSNISLSSEGEASDNAGNTYSVGFGQASGNNQNPFVEKKNSSGDRVWRLTYEATGVDGRATLVTVDGSGNPWVIFTVDGGSNDNQYITRKEVENNAFSGVYSNSYGSGGGPKVVVIARLNPDNGQIVKGTFITARLTNGRTNTLNITKIGFQNGNFAFEISSAAWPPGKGTSYQRFPDITDEDRVDGAFKIYYEINMNLSEIVEAVLLTE